MLDVRRRLPMFSVAYHVTGSSMQDQRDLKPCKGMLEVRNYQQLLTLHCLCCALQHEELVSDGQP